MPLLDSAQLLQKNTIKLPSKNPYQLCKRNAHTISRNGVKEKVTTTELKEMAES